MRPSLRWPNVAVLIFSAGRLYQAYSSRCLAKEDVNRKTLIQTQSQRQTSPVLLETGDSPVPFSDDALPPWALPRDRSGRVATADVQPPALLAASEASVTARSQNGERRKPHRLALSEHGQRVEGEPSVEDALEDVSAEPSSWMDRLLTARHAAQQAHHAVLEAHRHLKAAARRSHKHEQEHVSMLGHGKQRGAPEVMTMVYVMTVPVGIMSLGFGVLMIARFAEKGGDDERVEENPAPEEVLGGHPWRADESDGGGSDVAKGRLRAPLGTDLEERRKPRPGGGNAKDGEKKLQDLQEDLQQALAAVKKSSPEVRQHLNFRPFPETPSEGTPSRSRSAATSGATSGKGSTTVSESNSGRESPKDPKKALGQSRDEAIDSGNASKHVSSMEGKVKSGKRKGHRGRPDSSDEADISELSAGSSQAGSPTVTPRTTTCKQSSPALGLAS